MVLTFEKDALGACQGYRQKIIMGLNATCFLSEEFFLVETEKPPHCVNILKAHIYRFNFFAREKTLTKEN